MIPAALGLLILLGAGFSLGAAVAGQSQTSAAPSTTTVVRLVTTTVPSTVRVTQTAPGHTVRGTVTKSSGALSAAAQPQADVTQQVTVTRPLTAQASPVSTVISTVTSVATSVQTVTVTATTQHPPHPTHP